MKFENEKDSAKIEKYNEIIMMEKFKRLKI